MAFSPVVRLAFISLLLALVAHLDLELFQMDIKTAFLNENFKEEIYMDQPIGFTLKGQEDKVYRLKCPYMVSSSPPKHGTLDSMKS